jgi:ribosomal protein L3 glutamine methyltransferase
VNDLKTVRDMVRWGASCFNAAGLYFGHGTDNALDEALALVLFALHLDHALPETYLDCRLTGRERKAILKLFRRRIAKRLPAAYLIGRAWFAGLEFVVNRQVLVPRSPLAELIEQGFSPWLESGQATRALDLCTGSGCIAIAMAYHLPWLQVDAVDISAPALAVARKNRARLAVEDRVALYPGDLYAGLVAGTRYDLIVSNPPYVSSAEYRSLPAEYRREPVLGLEAADDGLEVVVRILRDAARWLTAEGVLMVEVGNSAAALQRRYPQVPFLWLTFERGGEGVFLLTREQLAAHQF